MSIGINTFVGSPKRIRRSVLRVQFFATFATRGDEESALDTREIIQRAHMSNVHSSFVSGKSLEFRLVARLNFPHPVAATLRVAKVWRERGREG